MIASVIVDIKAKQVNRSFDYLVPPHLEKVIKVGYRVRVVFCKILLVCFVVELKETTTFKKTLKPISDLVDVYPVLNEEFIEGTLEELTYIDKDTLIGEMVIIVEGNKNIEKGVSDEQILNTYDQYVQTGLSSKEAIKRISSELDVKKNYVYDLVIKNKID